MVSFAAHALDSAGKLLRERIESRQKGGPFVAGKLGTSELDALLWFLQKETAQPQTKKAIPQKVLTNICRNAGIFGPRGTSDEAAVISWCSYMLENLHLLDEVALWNPISPLGEVGLVRAACPAVKSGMPLRALEPFYQEEAENCWSLGISGPFAVVSPFATSIEKQWVKRETIFAKKPFSIWGPDAQLVGTIRTGYSPLICKKGEACSWSANILAGGWKFAVDNIVSQVKETGASIAIVGAGALSLPICFELKKAGITGIHTGGGTQIIFGIKGARWIAHSVISAFFNENWVSPASEEVPSGAYEVEGGCYWSR